jgi:hypothetical protein
MTSSNDPGVNSGRSFLERHWPLAVSILTFIVICFVYLAVYSTKLSSAKALLLAILPDIAASLLIAACLYILLNRNLRTPPPSEAEIAIRGEMQEQVEQLRSAAQAIHDFGGLLRRRSGIPPLESMFVDARVISISAVSGLGIINHHRGLLEEQIRRGSQIRVMLLDVSYRDALDSWDRLSNPPMNTPEEDIRAGVRQFLGLADLREYPGGCQVRLLNTTLPFSLVISEKKDRGEMQVEMHTYRRAPEDRPNILLSSRTDPHWFQFFGQQFNRAWESARIAER